MPQFIGREEVRRLVAQEEASVAEVLPRAEYEWAHLPASVRLPLKGWKIDRLEANIDRGLPVIVYCNDYQ